MLAVPAQIERTRSLLQISRVAVQFGLGAATKPHRDVKGQVAHAHMTLGMRPRAPQVPQLRGDVARCAQALKVGWLTFTSGSSIIFWMNMFIHWEHMS